MRLRRNSKQGKFFFFYISQALNGSQSFIFFILSMAQRQSYQEMAVHINLQACKGG